MDPLRVAFYTAFGALVLAACLRLYQSIATLKRKEKFCVTLPLLLGLISPSVIQFLVHYIVGRLSVSTALENTEILSWFIFSPITLLPFTALTIILIISTKVYSLKASYVLCIGGLIGIFWGMVPPHVRISALFYKPGAHISSTTAISYLFIPFYCFVPLMIGLAISWIISRLPFISTKI